MRPRRSRLRAIDGHDVKILTRPLTFNRTVTKDISLHVDPLCFAEKITLALSHSSRPTYVHLGEKMFGGMARTMKFSTVTSQNVFQPTMRLFKRYGYGLERLDFQSINLIELDQVTDYLRDYLVSSEGMKYLSKTRLFYRLSPIWRYENPMIHRSMRGFM